MTVSNTDRSVTAQGNGVTTEWPYGFNIPTAAGVNVLLTEIATGDQTVIESDDYTITGLNDPNGGEVTYPTVASGDPELTSDFEITIYRTVPQTQLVNVANQTRYDAGVVQGVWDRLTMMIQDIQGDFNLALRFPSGDTANNIIPSAQVRADAVLSFDSSGNATSITIAALGAVVVSDLDPVVAGTVDPGISSEVSRQDHVHPSAKDVPETLTNKIMNDLSNFIHADAVHLKSRNVSGDPFVKGQVIYESAYNSGQDAIEIMLADADDPAKMPAMAIIDEGILNNTNGDVIKVGTITGDATDNLNTTGGGEAWSVGDDLYVSTTAGELTNVRPTGAAEQVQAIAVVLRVHATLGTIFVDGAGRANDAPNVVDAEAYIGSRVGTDIADSAAPTLPTDGNYFEALGTTARTSYVVGAKRSWVEKTIGARTYTASASIVTEDGNDISATAGQVLFFQSTATNVVTVTKAPSVFSGISSGIAVASTSGTSIDFTGIPAGTSLIILSFQNVSASGASPVIIQIGNTTPETSGYVGVVNTTARTDGFGILDAANAAATRSGIITLSLLDSATNTWAVSGNIARGDSAVVDETAGYKILSDVLDILSITTAGGSDTFDLGKINILFM